MEYTTTYFELVDYKGKKIKATSWRWQNEYQVSLCHLKRWPKEESGVYSWSAGASSRSMYLLVVF